MHIAIAGNIGSGKTTLTSLLAKNFKWTAIYEKIDDNPYIENFYEDMRRWSFNLQIYFLNSRFRNVIEAGKQYKNFIQDRTLFEDAYVFAPTLYDMGLMSTRDYKTYTDMFELLLSFVNVPDLIIYLKASVPTLVRQIQKRGRLYESAIRLNYVSLLNDHYEKWVNNYKGRLLTIDMDEKEMERPEDLNEIIEKIIAELNPLV